MRPSEIDYRLDGWRLFVAQLEALETPDREGLAELRASVSQAVRHELDLATLSSHPPVAAMRKLFRAAGTDPTRYRPSSEALVRRLLKGDDVPSILPLVDLNNCLSARLVVPCCVMAAGTFEGPFVLRPGEEDESYESLRGPFRLGGRPLLVDSLGPCDTPITGSQRVKVTQETTHCTLVAYLPAEVYEIEEAGSALDGLLAAAPVARRMERTDDA